MPAEREKSLFVNPNLDHQANTIRQEASQLLGEWGLSGIRVLAYLPNHQIESFVQRLKERLQQT